MAFVLAAATTDTVADTVPPDLDADAAVDMVVARPAAALGVLVLTFLVVRLARAVLRAVVRRVADRSLERPTSFWRVRVPRLFGETAELAEKRRRQRIDATSRMLGHLFAVVAWITGVMVALHILRVDLLPVLTGAGFLGAGLAIGGQHAVKDFISGVGILVEDRFGVGDRVIVETKSGAELDGIVEYVGAFSTRISSGNSTWHFSNGDLGQVRNLSQTPVTTEIEIPVPEAALADGIDANRTADAVADALTRAAGNKSLTGMVLVDEVKAMVQEAEDGEATVRVELRTTGPLTGSQADRIGQVMADELWRVHERTAGDEPSDSEGGEPD